MSRQASTRSAVTGAGITLGIAVGIIGLSFGVGAVAAGASVWQTCAMSLLVFTGASQLSAVSVIAAGGSLGAALGGAVLLAARNGVYGLAMSGVLGGSLARRLVAAQITIDESTAMAIRYPAGSPQARHAFWTTGVAIFVLWNLGTLIGALGAAALDDPRTLGLDAAVPAGFIALLWPRLRDREAIAVAIAGASVAVALVPVLQPGLPVLAAALVAVIAERLTSGPDTSIEDPPTRDAS